MTIQGRFHLTITLTVLAVLWGSASQASIPANVPGVTASSFASLGLAAFLTESPVPSGNTGNSTPKVAPAPAASPQKGQATKKSQVAGPSPYLVGFLALALLYFLICLPARAWNPLKICLGFDGRLSTSKLQFFLWTVVVLFSYVVLYTARVESSKPLALASLPDNLLLAMGLSVATMTAAKGITSSYAASGRINKPILATSRLCFADIFQDDSGSPDLTKIQMMSWTLVALCAFLYSVLAAVGALPDKFALPDIDTALMVLMGLGQGAYVTKKAVATDLPHVNSATLAARGALPRNLTISGSYFGASRGQSQVTLDGVPIPIPAVGTTWGDTSVTIPLPAAAPNGAAWPVDGGAAAVVQVGVLVGGQESNRVPVSV